MEENVCLSVVFETSKRSLVQATEEVKETPDKQKLDVRKFGYTK